MSYKEIPSIIRQTYLPTFRLLADLFDNKTNSISSFKSKNTLNYNYNYYILQFYTKERETRPQILSVRQALSSNLSSFHTFVKWNKLSNAKIKAIMCL